MDRVFITYGFIFIVCYAFNQVSSAAVETSKPDGPNSKSKKEEQRLDVLIYPTEPPEDESLNRGGTLPPEVNPSPCPDNAFFCESADDYPKDFIKSRLKKQPKLLMDILYEEEIGDDVHNKFGPDSETEMELCTSTAKIVYPNKAQSKEGLFEFVVNDDEHKQGIRVETCTTNGGECKMMPAHILPLGYKSSCVQKYILRTLVVLNRNSTSDVQGFVTKPFEFPACCSCVITMTATGHDRFGGEADTTPAVAARPTNRSIKGTT